MPRKMTDDRRGELIDALLGMRTVLAEPGKWCQGTLAKRRYETTDGRLAEGPSVHPLSDDAEMFCLVGAASYVTRQPAAKHPIAAYLSGLLRRRGLTFSGSVQLWNDQPARTQTEVLGLIDTALEELKGG